MKELLINKMSIETETTKIVLKKSYIYKIRNDIKIYVFQQNNSNDYG